MKIVFCCAEDESLGVGYLSSHLKKHGHEVNLVFDPKQFDRPYTGNRRLATKYDRSKRNLARIEQIKPDLIGFSCVTANYRWAIQFARQIRERFDVQIIFGGVHPTLVPERVINEDAVDIVCVGEGEEALLDLVKGLSRGERRTDIPNLWFKDGQRIIKNGPRPLNQDLDGLAFPDKAMFYEQLPKHYRLQSSFLTSRGCPFTCTFCGNEQLKKIYKGQGKFVRRRSVDSCIKELRQMKERFGTKYVLFGDDILTTDIDWLNDFSTKYRKEIGLPFTCFGHAKYMDDDRAKFLKSAGCRLVWLGVQSGDEDLRRRILNRPESNEEIIKSARAIKVAGLKLMVDHIMDIPGESEDSVFESARLYNEIRPDMINVYNLLYFPTSRISEIAFEQGVLSAEDVGQIEQGNDLVYQTGARASDQARRDHYKKFAFMLTLIPLLSRENAARMIDRASRAKRVSSAPKLLIPLIKLELNRRIGHGFIPMAMVKTEWHWLREWYKTVDRRPLTVDRRLEMTVDSRQSTVHSESADCQLRTANCKPETANCILPTADLTITVLNNGLVVEEGMSGSDRRALEWSKAMAAAGYQVRVVGPAVGFKRFQSAGLDYYQTTVLNHRRWGYFLTYLLNAIKAVKLRPDFHPGDVVYSSSDLLADSIPAIFWKRRNPQIRWIAGVHLLTPALFSGYENGSGIKEFMRRLYHKMIQAIVIPQMRRRAEMVMVSNALDRDRLIRRGFDSGKVIVTYGAVDRMALTGPEEKEYSACFLGRLHPQKGIPDLFRVWRCVRNEVADARMAVIAEDDVLEFYVRHPEWHTEGIDFLGFLDGTSKYKVLSASEVLIFPSSHESFGMAACEAMACGTPVVAYDLPVYDEIYPQGMIKVPLGDTDRMAAAIIDLINDPYRRETMSRQATETAAKYRWENTSKALLDFIEKAEGGRSG